MLVSEWQSLTSSSQSLEDLLCTAPVRHRSVHTLTVTVNSLLEVLARRVILRGHLFIFFKVGILLFLVVRWLWWLLWLLASVAFVVSGFCGFWLLCGLWVVWLLWRLASAWALMTLLLS